MIVLNDLTLVLTTFYERRLCERTHASDFAVEHLHNRIVRVRLGSGTESAFVEITHYEIIQAGSNQDIATLLDQKMDLLAKTYEEMKNACSNAKPATPS